MSGPSARYALPEAERAPIDQRAPELDFTPSTAPGDAVPRAERREAILPDRPLGPPPSPAVVIDIGEIARLVGEIVRLFAELALGAHDHARGTLNSAAWRLRAAANRIIAATEPPARRGRV